ncbi:molybdenum cofactor guanylyltransferase [Microbacterium sp. EST19A]|uniref:molybdenum cofactor guanylyltransferase n=1 Tax=Microbacterium sp. EST19A TaxID=2862681 RepID=UPI001CBCA2B5|nr:NTP transferase domain-containing protein [Microbacterium sp. EST19A]
MTSPEPAAIVLAGGRASRLGGADKPQLVVDGATLLDHAVHAVSWCAPIIVVGPPAPVRTDVIWARESPPFGGPVAAIAAGLAHVDRDEVCILAADIPRAVDAVGLLRRQPSADVDGSCLADATGAAQWLVGRYRTAALRTALDALPDAGHDASIRSLVAGLRLDLVDAGDLAADVDTWDDLERARARPATAGSPTDEEDT